MSPDLKEQSLDDSSNLSSDWTHSPLARCPHKIPMSKTMWPVQTTKKTVTREQVMFRSDWNLIGESKIVSSDWVQDIDRESLAKPGATTTRRYLAIIYCQKFVRKPDKMLFKISFRFTFVMEIK